jgi:hypothetical protein
MAMLTNTHGRVGRWLLGLSGILGAGLVGQAAVLPYADPLAPPISRRAGLLTPVSSDVAGLWVGRTPDGQLIAVTLRVDSGFVEGDASLDGLMPEARGRQPLMKTTAVGKTVSFAVKPSPCGKALAHGVLTIVSRGAAHLSLHAGNTPISVQLSRVS